MNFNDARSLRRWPLALGFAFAAALAQPAPVVAAACNDCGVVQKVQHVETRGEASGVGAVAGGVIGHQFGSGRGNTAATIAGAGAGAYAGHQVEKNRNRKSYWSVAVKMDDGRTRTFTFGNRPEFHEGDRVKAVEGGKRLALLAR